MRLNKYKEINAADDKKEIQAQERIKHTYAKRR